MGKRGGFVIALLLLATGGLRLMAPGGTLPPDTSQDAAKTNAAKQEKGGPQRSHAKLNPSLGPQAVDLSDTIDAFFGSDSDAPLAPDSQSEQAPEEPKTLISQ